MPRLRPLKREKEKKKGPSLAELLAMQQMMLQWLNFGQRQSALKEKKKDAESLRELRKAQTARLLRGGPSITESPKAYQDFLAKGNKIVSALLGQYKEEPAHNWLARLFGAGDEKVLQKGILTPEGEVEWTPATPEEVARREELLKLQKSIQGALQGTLRSVVGTTTQPKKSDPDQEVLRQLKTKELKEWYMRQFDKETARLLLRKRGLIQ